MLDKLESGNIECKTLRAVTGITVRPGGYQLTRKAVFLCGLKVGSIVLDVGCGTGASVEYLNKEFALAAMGIDPSIKMLEMGFSRCAGLPIKPGKAESIEFDNKSLDAILCECSLSHFADIRQALPEFYRVLTDEGWLIVSDLYIRREKLQKKDITVSAVDSGFMEMGVIRQYLDAHGFEVILWEDHTDKLKQLSIDIIMKYGSMESFWELECHSCTNCSFSKVNTSLKLGYYLLIARKKPINKIGEDPN